jgi:hypothetical protein
MIFHQSQKLIGIDTPGSDKAVSKPENSVLVGLQDRERTVLGILSRSRFRLWIDAVCWRCVQLVFLIFTVECPLTKSGHVPCN